MEIKKPNRIKKWMYLTLLLQREGHVTVEKQVCGENEEPRAKNGANVQECTQKQDPKQLQLSNQLLSAFCTTQHTKIQHWILAKEAIPISVFVKNKVIMEVLLYLGCLCLTQFVGDFEEYADFKETNWQQGHWRGKGA